MKSWKETVGERGRKDDYMLQREGLTVAHSAAHIGHFLNKRMNNREVGQCDTKARGSSWVSILYQVNVEYQMLRQEGEWKLSTDYEVWGKRVQLERGYYTTSTNTTVSLRRNFTIGYYSLSIHLFLQVKYIMKSSTAHMFYIYTYAHPYGLNCFPPKFLCWEF